jgi:Na+/H+ antiporter NhaD/arsenite permease-like protein
MMPFLLVEGLLTNIGGLLTLISSVPNIIVGTTANISFMTFLIKAAPYVIVATAVTIWMGARFFRIRSHTTEQEKQESLELVSGFDENDGIESWPLFYVSIVMLVLFIILIAGTSALPVINRLGMGFVAMSMATLMLVFYRSEVDKLYRAIDWDLIGFFMALFVIIYVMERAAVLHWIGLALQSVIGNVRAESASPVDASVLLLGSAAFSSVTDNIPLSAMLASILHSLGAPNSSGLWWAVIFGSNLGGNLTPIGSASTLVAVTIMHKHQIRMTFLQFMRLAFLFAIVQIGLALVYVIFVIPLIPAV